MHTLIIIYREINKDNIIDDSYENYYFKIWVETVYKHNYIIFTNFVVISVFFLTKKKIRSAID